MRRGFTVLEILIALLIIAIGIVALYSLQIVAIDGNVTAQEYTQATTLAERMAERLRRDAISWTSTANLPASLNPDNSWRLPPETAGTMVNKDFVNPGMVDGAVVLDPRYCVLYRVQAVPPGQVDPKVLRVDVRVVWPRKDRQIPANLACNINDLLDTQSVRNTWQVSLPTLVFRHEETS